MPKGGGPKSLSEVEVKLANERMVQEAQKREQEVQARVDKGEIEISALAPKVEEVAKTELEKDGRNPYANNAKFGGPDNLYRETKRMLNELSQADKDHSGTLSKEEITAAKLGGFIEAVKAANGGKLPEGDHKPSAGAAVSASQQPEQPKAR